jgi:hypothetical protein
MLLVQRITDTGLIPSLILLDHLSILINALKIALLVNSQTMLPIQMVDTDFVFSIN